MFSIIKGQNQAINNLKQLISAGKSAQSYLFYGTEGVGKLTTAFEFAKAVNCHNQQNYESCDNCPSCHKIDHFSHPDVDFIFPTPKFELTEEGGYKKEETYYGQNNGDRVNHIVNPQLCFLSWIFANRLA